MLDHLTCLVTCIYELTLYALYLMSSPSQEAALVVATGDAPNLSTTQREILNRMRKTWELILELEGRAESNTYLRASCPHTRFFAFREMQTLLSEEKWQWNARTHALLHSWHPPLGLSANIEQVFNRMEDSTKRASKSNTASLCNLQCIAIRSVNRQIASGSNSPAPIELSTEDWEGKQVRNIKTSVWRPDAFSGSAPAAITHAARCYCTFETQNIHRFIQITMDSMSSH